MALRCAPEFMKALMASWSRQTVQVQNVQLASDSVRAPRLPGANLACRLERSAYQSRPGTKRHERSRSRVVATNAIFAAPQDARRLPPSNLETLQRSLVEQLLDLDEPR